MTIKMDVTNDEWMDEEIAPKKFDFLKIKCRTFDVENKRKERKRKKETGKEKDINNLSQIFI